jgi:hypothetical protein
VTLWVLAGMLMLCLSGTYQNTSEPCDFSIEGRVIDERGRPVEGADVSFWIEGAHLVHGGTSDHEGNFRVGPWRVGDGMLHLKLIHDRWLLFVANGMTDFDSASYLIVPTALHDLLTSDPRRIPHEIKPECGTNILGDFKVQLDYGRVDVRLVNEKGAPLLPRQTSEATDLWLRVKDFRTGETVGEGGIRSAETDFSNSSVRLGLPEGKWILEFRTRTGAWIPATSPVEPTLLRRSRVTIVAPGSEWR